MKTIKVVKVLHAKFPKENRNDSITTTVCLSDMETITNLGDR